MTNALSLLRRVARAIDEARPMPFRHSYVAVCITNDDAAQLRELVAGCDRAAAREENIVLVLHNPDRPASDAG